MASGTFELTTSCSSLADQFRGSRDGSDVHLCMDPLQQRRGCIYTSWTTRHCRPHQRLVRSNRPECAFAFPGELCYVMLALCLNILRALRGVYLYCSHWSLVTGLGASYLAFGTLQPRISPNKHCATAACKVIRDCSPPRGGKTVLKRSTDLVLLQVAHWRPKQQYGVAILHGWRRCFRLTLSFARGGALACSASFYALLHACVMYTDFSTYSGASQPRILSAGIALRRALPLRGAGPFLTQCSYSLAQRDDLPI